MLTEAQYHNETSSQNRSNMYSMEQEHANTDTDYIYTQMGMCFREMFIDTKLQVQRRDILLRVCSEEMQGMLLSC